MERQRVGFVGLGLMGSEMIRSLLSEGFSVTGFDIDPKKVALIIEAGGKGIKDPAQLASRVDVIILSLPNSHVVDSVVTNDLRLFEAGGKGLILIDTTTADPTMSEALAARLREKGIEMLDATIIGGPKMFAEKEVTLMVGGAETIFPSCESILSALSKKVFYVGKNGSGALMKLLVNLVGGLNRMVLSEALCLSKRAGIDPRFLLEVLNSSALASKAMESKGRRMIEEAFLPAAGKLAFHLKDVRLMLDLAERLNFPLPLSSLHAQALTSLVANGKGDWDNSAIISFYNELANL